MLQAQILIDLENKHYMLDAPEMILVCLRARGRQEMFTANNSITM